VTSYTKLIDQQMVYASKYEFLCFAQRRHNDIYTKKARMHATKPDTYFNILVLNKELVAEKFSKYV
jgi:hypothetical protein